MFGCQSRLCEPTKHLKSSLAHCARCIWLILYSNPIAPQLEDGSRLRQILRVAEISGRIERLIFDAAHVSPATVNAYGQWCEFERDSWKRSLTEAPAFPTFLLDFTVNLSFHLFTVQATDLGWIRRWFPTVPVTIYTSTISTDELENVSRSLFWTDHATLQRPDQNVDTLFKIIGEEYLIQPGFKAKRRTLKPQKPRAVKTASRRVIHYSKRNS